MAARHSHRWWTTLVALALLFCAISPPARAAGCGGEITWSEDFESGWGDWYPDYGVWQIGAPTSGPGEAHEGRAVAGTNLSGDYPSDTDSRLVSPAIALPTVAGDERIQLRFWHWFSLAAQDSGTVQISLLDSRTGEWSDWTTLISVSGESVGWSPMKIDLTAHADQYVQFGFFHSAERNYWGDPSESSGWYVDEVQVWKGAPTLAKPETFEFGWCDWLADNGVWEIGEPRFGPEGAHQGICVAGTVLGADYPGYQDSRLISPTITLPTVDTDEKVQLRFWQWFSYSSDDGGAVQIRVSDSRKQTWGDWTDMTSVGDASGVWCPMVVDLTEFAGKHVQIAFSHTAERNYWGDASESSGWYIDDVRIWKGVPVFVNAETFQFGWGDWSATNGVWEVAQSSIVPPSFVSGGHCAGTVLNADYPGYTDSRLVSPMIQMPEISSLSPGIAMELRFWHWFSYSSYDSGTVQVRAQDSTTGRWGDWNDAASIDGVSAVWSPMRLSLSAYAGKQVQIAFLHKADRNYWGDASESSGWYIDDVQITPAPEAWWVSEDTGVSRTDRLTNDTTPELTFVFPHVVNGQNSDIEVANPDDVVMVPDSVSGWGTSTVVVRYATPLSQDDEYTVTLKGTITDAQGQAIHDGADKVLHFTLDTKAPVLTAAIEITEGATIVLTGTVDDPDATVEVIIGNKRFASRNCGNGTWVLPGDMIDSASAGGINDAVAVGTDSAGNVTTPPVRVVPVPPPPCDLALSSSEGGTVAASSDDISCGDTVVVEATSNAGYRFVRWEGTAWDQGKVTVVEQDDSGSTVEVLVDGVYTLTAVFEPLLGLTLAVIGQGSTDPEPGTYYVSSGETVCVTAVADSGFRFCRWEGTCLDTAASADESTICVTVDGACTLTAVFEEAVYDISMDVDPAWTLEGQWEFGRPTGQRCGGWGNNDPASGHTAQNVFAVNLDGCYDLAIGGPYYATTKAFDLSNCQNVRLRFWRWLNSDIPEWVKSTVEVSTDDLNWTVVWTPKEREEITDTEWTLCEYDLSQADCQSTVYLRWGYHVLKERAYAYTGWNIDDVQLIGCLGCDQ